MIDLKNFDPKKDLQNFLKPHGEKALAEYRTKFTQDLQRISEKNKSILKDSDNFKLQLITIAGGTISIFVALQGNFDVSLLTKLGFAGLGISLILGIASLFFSLESKRFEIQLEESSNLFQQKQSLDFLEKFYYLDINPEREILSYSEGLKKEYDADLKKRQEQINKILNFIHLDAQKIENGQLILFMIGVLYSIRIVPTCLIKLTKVAVKIIDMLGEEALVTKRCNQILLSKIADLTALNWAVFVKNKNNYEWLYKYR